MVKCYRAITHAIDFDTLRESFRSNTDGLGHVSKDKFIWQKIPFRGDSKPGGYANADTVQGCFRQHDI